ncbi:baseplate J/gp47 family protein [Chromobacterium piscinae]|uniref:baseplate assembly protein n=1 Tax=Chromobacterium piscinae TaxID=686831 RepID=UPI001E466EF0|nr:baseplate J/gp47 family protein [Chromobacterium piscinae]MCD4505520.1 baseplate J/gp47 family protein [Chromobacterium piscinae]
MIDLPQLPPPEVVEELDFEAIYAAKLARFKALYPQYSAVLESDMVVKILELFGYDEMMVRARLNDGARACMLAYARGADLDHRAADFGVQRLLILRGDPEAEPPTEDVWEDDERLRYRTQMALEGLAAAGPSGAYRFHALSASADVADVDIDTPAPGQVRVWLLARADVAAPALLDTVSAALNDETVRPLCDTVMVAAAVPLGFDIRAEIVYEPGGEVISGGLDAARQRLAAMLAARRRIRGSVPRSAIDAALHVPGVDRVSVVSPAGDVLCQLGQFPDCLSVSVSVP